MVGVGGVLLSPERPSQDLARLYNWPAWATYPCVCGVTRVNNMPMRRWRANGWILREGMAAILLPTHITTTT